jgi:hypothetical protein
VSERRVRILEMLAEGKITVDEAQKLLESVSDPAAATATYPEPRQAAQQSGKTVKAPVETRVPLPYARCRSETYAGYIRATRGRRTGPWRVPCRPNCQSRG